MIQYDSCYSWVWVKCTEPRGSEINSARGLGTVQRRPHLSLVLKDNKNLLGRKGEKCSRRGNSMNQGLKCTDLGNSELSIVAPAWLCEGWEETGLENSAGPSCVRRYTPSGAMWAFSSKETLWRRTKRGKMWLDLCFQKINTWGIGNGWGVQLVQLPEFVQDGVGSWT